MTASKLTISSEPGAVWRITLARPEARNALSSPMLEAMVAELGRAAVDPECRVVILAGEGRDFCAGADLAELTAAREGSGAIEYGRVLEAALRVIEDQPQPVIVAVHGAALGAGCQLVTATDLAVAAEDSRIGIPSARLGIVIGYQSLERLVLSVGAKRAGELVLAGRTLTGYEAAAWGLVNQAVRVEDLSARVEELARTIASLAPLSVRASKRGIRAMLDGLTMARSADASSAGDFDLMAAEAFASQDLGEGLDALRERRTPRFRGKGR
jgi:enoyl-CoA hydratase/carnithine racemase